MGHSGSGKSTIASLILRFYDSSRGQIVIDGQDLKKIAMPYLRDKISIVQQEPLLFNETIKENILFGNLDANDHEVRTVATQANAMGFIMQNDDDVSSVAVQERLKAAFEEVARTCIPPRAEEYPNFTRVPSMVENGRISYKDLALIIDVLPNLSQSGL